MQFVCLGYLDEKKWAAIPEGEQKAFMEQCFAYDDELRERGHVTGGEALLASRKGVTLRFQDGKVMTTDGPYAETKEVLGGIVFLEANDLKHAIALMSKHPGLRMGPFEIQAVNEEGCGSDRTSRTVKSEE